MHLECLKMKCKGCTACTRASTTVCMNKGRVMQLGGTIKDRQQEAHFASLHYSLGMCCRESCYMPNESSFSCLSNHIIEITINLIFRKLWILNQFLISH